MADSQNLPLMAAGGRAPAASPFDAFGTMMRQPAVQRALPALGLAGAVAAAGFAWWGFQRPAQVPVFQGLTESDKQAVAEALQSAGMPYRVDESSGSVTVAEDSLYRARMMLAGQGLPKAAPSGDSVLAKLPLGASQAVESETLRGARETDLARTIEAIDAVKSARIHIAVPEPSVFVRDQAEPAASVMLTLQPGRKLTDAQVQAIRHLVASSVSGLAASQVSIIDQSGSLLTDQDGSPNAQQFQLQVDMEERYRKALAQLLAPIVGAGNYTAEVHVDLDMSESQSTRETYPKDDAALRREEGNRSSTTPPGTPGGIPGATSNQPPPATQVATRPGGAGQAGTTASGPTQTAETYNRAFDVGREISVRHDPQGRIVRLSVAVALRDAPGGKARGAADITAIETLVKGAVGFQATRGDVVAITSRPFQQEKIDPPGFWEAPWFMPLVRQIVAGIVAILAFFFIVRPALRNFKERRAASSAASAALEQQLLDASEQGLLEGSAPRPTSQGRGEITIEMIEAAPSYEQRALLVRHFVKQDPKRAAMVVRRLIESADNG